MSKPSELSRREVLGIASTAALVGVLGSGGTAWASAVAQPSTPGSTALSLSATQQAVTITHQDGFKQSISTDLAELTFSEGAVHNLAPTTWHQTSTPTGPSFTYQYPSVSIAGTSVQPTLTVEQSSNAVARAWLDIVVSPGKALTLERVTILRFTTTEAIQRYGPADWQSRPLYTPHFVYGVEFPVANANVTGSTVTLGHAPGTKIDAGGTLRTHAVAIVAVEAGHDLAAFHDYFWSLRDGRPRVHINYNQWWTLSFPFTAQQSAQLIDAVMPAGSSGPTFDSFTLDMGWSTPHGVWTVDRDRFPDGFGPLARQLQGRGSGLGLWWSPSNMYSPNSFDNDWADANGYETFIIPGGTLRLACLAKGTRYQQETLANLRDYAQTAGLAQVKFDGYYPECPASDHGHLPGELSREAIAAGIIEIFEMLRDERPNIWLEPTCFGDGSPWWLRWTDSITGGFGDDKPPGVVPAPTYRQSYTTTRDFFVLSGVRADPAVPVATEEDLGIIQQTPEPVADDDAVTAALRGHHFLSMYVNPYVLDQQEVDFLGRLERWLHSSHGDTFDDTIPLYPSSWPAGTPGLDSLPRMREPYGYAHRGTEKAIVIVRNPWIETASITVPLEALPTGPLGVRQLYPAPRGIAGTFSTSGHHGLSITLHAYETKVLSFDRGESDVSPVADPGDTALDSLTLGPATVTTGTNTVTATFVADVAGSGWRLHTILEHPTVFDLKTVEVHGNGKSLDQVTSVVDSASGFAAFSNPALRGNLWKYVSTDLTTGKNDMTLKVETSTGAVKCSAWIIRRVLLPGEPNGSSAFPVAQFPFVMAARRVFQTSVPG